MLLNIKPGVDLKQAIHQTDSYDEKTFSVCGEFTLYGKVPQYHGHLFYKRVLLPYEGKFVSTNDFPRNSLKEFPLLKRPLYHDELQEITHDQPMSQKAFLALAYMLVIDPELGKRVLNYELKKEQLGGNKYEMYYFQVMLDDLTVPVMIQIRWVVDRWYFNLDWIEHGREGNPYPMGVTLLMSSYSPYYVYDYLFENEMNERIMPA
jgi:hypothetical protein